MCPHIHTEAHSIYRVVIPTGKSLDDVPAVGKGSSCIWDYENDFALRRWSLIL